MYRLNQRVYSAQGDLVGRYKGNYVDYSHLSMPTFPILEKPDGYCYVHFAPVQPPLEEYVVQLTDPQFRTLFAAFAHQVGWDCVVVNNHWKYLTIWIEVEGVFVSATNVTDGEPEITFEEAILLLDSKVNK
jgi:hypothetical protein